MDTAVYTRNRAFRLYLSSKAGKQVSGLIQHQSLHYVPHPPPYNTTSGPCGYPPHPPPDMPLAQAVLDSTARFGGAALLTQEELFNASLITNVAPGTRLLRWFDDSAEVAAAATAAGTARAGGRPAAAAGAQRGMAAGPGQVCYGPSPFPDIEAFISSVCCEVSLQRWQTGMCSFCCATAVRTAAALCALLSLCIASRMPAASHPCSASNRPPLPSSCCPRLPLRRAACRGGCAPGCSWWIC